MYYVKTNNLKFAQQIGLLGTYIESIKDLFGFSKDDIEEAKNDAEFMLWITNETKIAETFYHSLTNYSNTIRYGTNDKVNIPVPVLSVIAIDPVLVSEGIQARYTQKINQIKASKKCSDNLLKKLNVFKSVTATNPILAKPHPKVKMDGGFPVISYHKYGFKAANLYKNSGKGYDDKAYKTMTTTSFKDTAPLPLAGESFVWKYKMVYLLKDIETGIFSNEISISVLGKK